MMIVASPLAGVADHQARPAHPAGRRHGLHGASPCTACPRWRRTPAAPSCRSGSPLLGLGLAPVMVGATEVIVGNAPMELSGVAGGLQQAAMQIGGSLGTAVLGAVMASKVDSDLPVNWTDAGRCRSAPVSWTRPPRRFRSAWPRCPGHAAGRRREDHRRRARHVHVRHGPGLPGRGRGRGRGRLRRPAHQARRRTRRPLPGGGSHLTAGSTPAARRRVNTARSATAPPDSSGGAVAYSGWVRTDDPSRGAAARSECRTRSATSAPQTTGVTPPAQHASRYAPLRRPSRPRTRHRPPRSAAARRSPQHRAAAAPQRPDGLGSCATGRALPLGEGRLQGRTPAPTTSPAAASRAATPLPAGPPPSPVANRTGRPGHHLPVRRVRGDRRVRDVPGRRHLAAALPVPGTGVQDPGELSPHRTRTPRTRRRAAGPPWSRRPPVLSGVYASPPAAPGSADATSSSW